MLCQKVIASEEIMLGNYGILFVACGKYTLSVTRNENSFQQGCVSIILT